MSKLTKIYINSNSDSSIKFAVKEIQNWIKSKNEPIKGTIIMGSNLKIYYGKINFIPQLFNNFHVFISSESFQQNNLKLGILIRKYVSNQIKLLNTTKILCIGGESYLYGLTCNISQILHLTNSSYIHSDCDFNSKFYSSNILNCLVDYNKIKTIDDNYLISLINLPNLNHNLMKEINKSKLETLIIINCHHKDFWKKIKLLSKFKIISRKQLICKQLKYFITVSVFSIKECYKLSLF